MATEVVMPKLGNEIESCVILAWRKKEGDSVAKGEALCEIETDKANFEIESPAAGVLLAIFHKEGADVPVMEPIAVIGQPGEPVVRPLPKVSFVEEYRGAIKVSTMNVPGLPGDPTPATPPIPAGGSAGSAGVSPRARKLAGDAGLDPAALAGTGPGGRVIERDVRAELAGREPLTPVAKARLAVPREGTGIGGHVRESDLDPHPPSPDYSKLGPAKDTPVKGIRKTIAARMIQSVRTTAQVTLHAAADASALRTARGRLKTDAATYGVTINDLVMHAVVGILPKFPGLNAWFLGDKIVEFEQVHLGVAVQTPRGLLAPVIRRAEVLSLIELSAEGKRLAQACLDGTVRPAELSGATFTVTNLGPQGIEFFTPLLNPPEVAILGVGSIVVRPVEGRGGLKLVPHIGLSLTFDHQAIDGHGAAVFLEALAEAIIRTGVSDA